MITPENLFSRKKICNASPNEVLEFLEKNNFSTKREKLPNTSIFQNAPQNAFCKDGYMYLLRGTRAKQETGFFSYLYSQKGLTTLQFSEKNKHLTPEILAVVQNLIGKSSFISTTTDVLTAAIYADKYYSNGDIGNIYLIKIPIQHVYQIPISATLKIGSDILPLNLSDEVEYLIPDFVLPNEIIGSFDINDFQELYRFLTDKIGLQLSIDDLGIKKEWMQNKFLSTVAIISGVNSISNKNLQLENLAYNLLISNNYHINFDREISKIPNKQISKKIKKSLNYEDIISKMQTKNTISILLKALNDIKKQEYLFISSSNLLDHNLAHTKRDMFLVTAIGTELNLSKRDIEILLASTLIHDIGRTHDWEDSKHGEKALNKITTELNSFSKDEQDLIKFIAVNHCKSKKENLETLLQIEDEEKREYYKKMLFIFKDADKLERVRINDLDTSRLEFEVSKQLVEVAKKHLIEYNNFEKRFSVKPVSTGTSAPKVNGIKKSNITGKSLFSRRETCICVDDKNQMCEDVKNFLHKSRILY